MAIGTLFTLFVLPSLYMLLAKDRALLDRSPATAASGWPVTGQTGGRAER
jgi:hypothetical protein